MQRLQTRAPRQMNLNLILNPNPNRNWNHYSPNLALDLLAIEAKVLQANILKFEALNANAIM